MDTSTVLAALIWVRSSLFSMLGRLFQTGWFFPCLIAFPILRYFFRKFLKSF